jgi:hypothetical protein
LVEVIKAEVSKALAKKLRREPWKFMAIGKE